MKDVFETVCIGVITREFRGIREILIGRKQVDSAKVFSDQWHLPGGKPSANEDPKAAVIREMREETGLSLTCQDLITTSSWGRQLEDGQFKTYHCYWYHLEPVDPSQKPIAMSDLTELKWVRADELNNFRSISESGRLPKKVWDLIGGSESENKLPIHRITPGHSHR